MIGYATSVLGILGATLIPAFISLYLISNLKFIKLQYIVATGIGLAFWFFFDTMGDAAQLDVNDGFTGGLSQIGLVVVFLLGIAVLAIFDHVAVPSSNVYEGISPTNPASSKYSKLIFLIPAGIAIVMGMHGFGEGWDFASAAAATQTGSILDAFGGGLSAIVSYLFHKFLEAAIIAAVYTAFVARNSIAIRARWHLPALGLLFGGPSVLGASIGYYVSLDTTFFYAFGVTAAFYATFRLAEAINPKFKIGEGDPIKISTAAFLAFAIGFMLLYGAALLHSG